MRYRLRLGYPVASRATATLEEYQPAMLMELARFLYPEHGKSLDDLLSLLTGAGFDVPPRPQI